MIPYLHSIRKTKIVIRVMSIFFSFIRCFDRYQHVLKARIYFIIVLTFFDDRLFCCLYYYYHHRHLLLRHAISVPKVLFARIKLIGAFHTVHFSKKRRREGDFFSSSFGSFESNNEQNAHESCIDSSG